MKTKVRFESFQKRYTDFKSSKRKVIIFGTFVVRIVVILRKVNLKREDLSFVKRVTYFISGTIVTSALIYLI